MEEENKKSNALKIIFWIATIGCFIFGYYNTHLGLRAFNAFGSGNGGWGSWFLAAIPLVMVFGGYVAAVQGKKGMLALYLTGEIIFFVFNLTYLYPTYLGRTLVKEEAQALNDSLTSYQTKIDNLIIKKTNETGADLQGLTKNIRDLRIARNMLLKEIIDRKGFGSEAQKQLDIINKIAETNLTGEREIGDTPEKRQKLYDDWKKLVDDVIKDYRKRMIGDQQIADKLFELQDNITELSDKNGILLSMILLDDTVGNINSEKMILKEQSKKLQGLTTELDKIADNVNSIAPHTFNKIAVTNRGTIPFPKTQQLGTFQHTMISVGERIGKLDTWGVIIICFFFDLLGPFLFYFYLRKDDTESYGTDEGAFDKPWWKRIFGID